MSNKVLMNKYPSISDLEKKAQSRIPKVSWLYLQSGTGRNISTIKNRSRFDQFSLLPSFIRGKLDPDF